MERTILLVFALFLAACGPTSVSMDTDASVVGPTDEEIMLDYEADIAVYQEEAGLSDEWANWMIQGEREDRGKGWWSKAYINGRRGDHEVRVHVRYQSEVPYNPPWANEEEHFAALKYLAELQYPGWGFTFLAYGETDLEENDIVAILGGSGYSYAGGRTVYLVFETIFAHEFGHLLGLHHHYCGDEPSDHCPENFPPGEGNCIMARNSVSFGPTENSFLLLTTGERQDEKIKEAVSNINNRYPGHFAPTAWDECGME